MIEENPIVLTQWRMFRRTGVAAPLAVAGLTSLGVVFSHLYDDSHRAGLSFSTWKSGLSHYWLLLTGELLLLLVVAPLTICVTLARERSEGQLDGNRLTPSPTEVLAAGYWLGPGARYAAMSALLAVGGLVVALTSPFGMPWWLGTQWAIWSSALFVWLLAALLGVATSASGGAAIFLLLGFFAGIASTSGSQNVPKFLLPIATLSEFREFRGWESVWDGTVKLYGFRLPSTLVGFALQLAFGVFAWRAFVRKIRRPTAAAFTDGDALAVYALLVFAQHMLTTKSVGHQHTEQMLFTHLILAGVGLLLVGAQAMGAPTSVFTLPAQARPPVVHTAPARAVALAAIAGSALWLFEPVPLPLQLVRVSHYFVMFVVLAAVIEASMARYGSRGPGVMALAFFVLWLLPLLGALFDLPDVARFSILGPTATFARHVSIGEVYLSWTAPVTFHLVVTAAMLAGWWAVRTS